MRSKNGGKKSLEKSVEKVFYIHTNTVKKKWLGKKARINFSQEHTNSASKKCWGKNLRKEVKKNGFFYSHEYRYQKMGGKNARNNFSRNTRIVRAKNVGEKIVGKKCEIRFFIFTRIP